MKTQLAILLSVCLAIISCSGEKKYNEITLQTDNALIKQFFSRLENSTYIVETHNREVIPAKEIKVTRQWDGNICHTSITNISNKDLYPKDVIIFNIPAHGLDANSHVYGEGFQMLHQIGGTLGAPQDIGNHSDAKHYKIPEVHGLSTAYGMLNINVGEDNALLAFPSCHRFIGRISYDSQQILVSVDTEGLKLKPGETWDLEDFLLLDGKVMGDLYAQLATQIEKHHPRLKTKTIPTGWCSWYCYGPDINDEIIEENLNIFSEKLPELEYIQLDDGYQPFMGDWLDPNPAYGDVRKTIETIRQKGFEPAIWLAPFIAQAESRVYREHPEWFVKNAEGQPLNSGTVGFGGWREGPWFCLDGTHPEVQEHLKEVTRIIREEWGVNYFKLDANYWGAIHNGFHYDKNATRIQAYRQGMEAILEGCDENTVVLGCNAPMWPSFGLVTAMRTSGDIVRKWNTIRSTAQENLSRCWQNGALWDADPDCIVLAPEGFGGYDGLSDDEWFFHVTSIHAVGGMMLSSDKAELLDAPKIEILKKLLVPTGKGASFNDVTLRTGITDLGDKQYYYFFNWGEEPIDLSVDLKTKSKLKDYWSEEDLGVNEGQYSVLNIPPHSAKLIEAKPLD